MRPTTDPEMAEDSTPKIGAQTGPRMRDAILLDPALYAPAVDALYRRRASLNLDPESLQLLQTLYHTQFRAWRVRGTLPKAEQGPACAWLNSSLSSLDDAGSRQNVLKATADGAVVVDSAAGKIGRSVRPEQIGAAAQAAAARGLAGKWLISAAETPPISRRWRSFKNRGLAARRHIQGVH